MKDINKREFEQLCTLGCKPDEFESMLDASNDEIKQWCEATYGVHFEDIYKRLNTKGKIALKSYRWTAAKSDAEVAAKLEDERAELEVLAALLSPPSEGFYNRYI